MKILFRNHSSQHIELDTGDIKQIIPAMGTYECESDSSQFSFSLNPYEKSDIKYIFRHAGVVRKRSFCTLVSYSAKLAGNTVINLYTDKAKGNFADEYTRIVAVSDTALLSPVFYKVADEAFVKAELEKSKKKGNQALFMFDILDIIGNAFTVLLLLLIPFALIWLFGSFETAYTVCGYLFIPIFAIIVIINRFFDKYKKKLWFFIKGKVLENKTFQGTDSYFSEEYIREVFGKKG